MSNRHKLIKVGGRYVRQRDYIKVASRKKIGDPIYSNEKIFTSNANLILQNRGKKYISKIKKARTSAERRGLVSYYARSNYRAHSSLAEKRAILRALNKKKGK